MTGFYCVHSVIGNSVVWNTLGQWCYTCRFLLLIILLILLIRHCGLIWSLCWLGLIGARENLWDINNRKQQEGK